MISDQPSENTNYQIGQTKQRSLWASFAMNNTSRGGSENRTHLAVVPKKHISPSKTDSILGSKYRQTYSKKMEPENKRATTLISGKMDFKLKLVKTDESGHFMLTKGTPSREPYSSKHM